MERWIIDTRYALLRLRSRPLYASLWVLTLALGIGGTAAATVILSAFLVKPLPYPDESTLFGFWAPFDWSEAEHVALRPDYPGFEAVATYREEPLALRQGEAPAKMIQGIASSTELFEVLGVQPARGRTFRASEDLHQGLPPVLVLSYRLWQELGGGQGVLGSFLKIDGESREVVGIMPEGFYFPEPKIDLWMTTALDPNNRSGNYALVGRSQGPLDAVALNTHTQQIAARLAEHFEYPAQWDKTKHSFAIPLREELLGSARGTLFATQIAMIAILLMAAANVAALMLGQLGTRAEELRVRYALGAPRSRLARQFILEALLLGFAAGTVAAGFALVVFQVLVSAMPLGPLADTIGSVSLLSSANAGASGLPLAIQLPAIAIGLSLVTSLVISLVPVIALWRGSAGLALTGSGRGSLGGRGGKMEGGLVVAEIAVAALLVAVAGLLLQSASNLRQIDTGIETSGVAVVSVNAPASEGGDRRLETIGRLQQALLHLPGVEAAAAVQVLPLSGGGWSTSFDIENVAGHEGATTYFRMVTEDYFDVMGISLVSGRGLLATDAGTGQAVTVINQALADRFFPDVDPLGQRISHGMRDGWARVVGVVENEAVGKLTDAASPTRYLHYRDVGFTPQGHSFVVRASTGASMNAVLPLLRSTIERVEPQVAVDRTTTMEQVHTEAMGATPQLTGLLILLGALALVLGMIGIYGVINHFVTQRRQEWSLRMALGLEPLAVLRHVVRRGAALIIIGLMLGLAATRMASQLLSNILYGTDAFDRGTLLVAATVLACSGLVAAFIPAWKAGRTDPASLLRK